MWAPCASCQSGKRQQREPLDLCNAAWLCLHLPDSTSITKPSLPSLSTEIRSSGPLLSNETASNDCWDTVLFMEKNRSRAAPPLTGAATPSSILAMGSLFKRQKQNPQMWPRKRWSVPLQYPSLSAKTVTAYTNFDVNYHPPQGVTPFSHSWPFWTLIFQHFELHKQLSHINIKCKGYLRSSPIEKRPTIQSPGANDWPPKPPTFTLQVFTE